uniref:Uncharacterized protein n=1 Tax=Rhizophora mucronata TaxID=61149 RepID=A0A2P2PLV5_RHIMU
MTFFFPVCFSRNVRKITFNSGIKENFHLFFLFLVLV